MRWHKKYSMLYVEEKVTEELNLDETIEIIADKKTRRGFIDKFSFYFIL